jgi:anti-sigma factor RsiW
VKRHEPNLDMLSAYVDGVLSHDAARSMEQHLARCEACASAVAAERSFVASLDTLAEVRPPADFVEAVMGRVAQHPVQSPSTPIPWRSAVRASVAASVLLVVLLGSGTAWLVSSGALEGVDPAGLAAQGISGVVGLFTSAFIGIRDMAAPAMALLENAGKVLWRLANFTVSSSWVVQVTLLLLTVSLNYAFTRLVLGYQRRH